jgi:hypothetical protein
MIPVQAWLVASTTRRLLALIALVLALALEARAVPVQFVYRFQSGETLTGVVEGDLQPDGVTLLNISSLDAVYSELPNYPFRYLSPTFYVQRSLKLDASLDFELAGFNQPLAPSGAFPNLGFRLRPGFSGNGATLGTFIANETSQVFPMGAAAWEFEQLDPARFVAFVVPEPAPRALLLPALLALALWLRARSLLAA